MALCCGGVAHWCRSLHAASLEYPRWPHLLYKCQIFFFFLSGGSVNLFKDM